MQDSRKWTDKDRNIILDTLAELSPEQRARFPKDVQRGERGFKITERWLLDKLFNMQPGFDELQSKAQ